MRYSEMQWNADNQFDRECSEAHDDWTKKTTNKRHTNQKTR